jgi:Ca2+-binding EF-hand superfamily protein
MKIKTTLVTAACVLAMGFPVFAQEEADEPKKHRDPAEKFAEADSNSDGKLSLDEFKAAREQKLDQVFERLDADKDGSLTEEELKAGRRHGKHGGQCPVDKEKGDKEQE